MSCLLSQYGIDPPCLQSKQEGSTTRKRIVPRIVFEAGKSFIPNHSYVLWLDFRDQPPAHLQHLNIHVSCCVGVYIYNYVCVCLRVGVQDTSKHFRFWKFLRKDLDLEGRSKVSEHVQMHLAEREEPWRSPLILKLQYGATTFVWCLTFGWETSTVRSSEQLRYVSCFSLHLVFSFCQGSPASCLKSVSIASSLICELSNWIEVQWSLFVCHFNTVLMCWTQRWPNETMNKIMKAKAALTSIKIISTYFNTEEMKKNNYYVYIYIHICYIIYIYIHTKI